MTDWADIFNMSDGSGIKDKEREIIMDFIDIYKTHTALWKVKSKEYSNRELRNKGLEELREKLKELIPHCTKDDVMKKINSLRSSFRRELRKHESSKKSGNATDDIYTPTLWYFNDLMFICDQELPREGISNLDSPITYEEVSFTWLDKRKISLLLYMHELLSDVNDSS